MVKNPDLPQLPLPFDTLPAAGSIYKAGDWVKVQRKPAIAASVKKGQIFRINTVHIIDGSLRFWNPQTSQQDFLYPDEVKLVPPPKVDSVTPIVEPVVTESIAEPVVTESIAEPVVTESIAEPVVTESNFSKIDSVTNFVSAISTYRPRGTARSGEYFRFSYRDGGKVRHIHIRGGNTDSPIAQARVEEVRSLLAAGVSPIEVAASLNFRD